MYCFFAHHRSASSSTNDILRELARILGWRHCTLHNPAMFNNDLPRFCRDVQPDLLTLSNARVAYLQSLPDFRAVHLIRDPRDVLVSSYFSHRDSHPTEDWPELPAHRAQLQALDEEAGLLLEMDCRDAQFADLAAWRYDDPRILEWRMEDLVERTSAHFQELLVFWGYALTSAERTRLHCGLSSLRARVNRLVAVLERRAPGVRLPYWRGDSVTAPTLSSVLAKHSYSGKTAGRQPGSPAANHHYRQGMSGDWRRHFTPEVTRQFRRRYGGLLRQLGYERGDNW